MARLKLTKFGRDGHAYRLDCDCPGRYRKTDPHRTIGVTTVLKTLSKDALTGWAGRITADYAVDHWAELDDMPPSERLQVLRDVQWNAKNTAALKGKDLHRYAEALAHGRQVTVPSEARPEVEGLARWMDREGWVSWGGEVPVCNTRWKYAGTLDNIGLLERRGIRALVDFKRQPRAYEEVAWQLSAYRYADLWQPDGPDSEAPMPEVDGCYVVLVRPDAEPELLPVETDETSLREFLYMMQVAHARAAVEDDSRIGAPLPPLADHE